MPEDTPGEEQPTMLSFTEAAERLVADGIAQSMTAEGLRKLARDPASGWPIAPDDYRVVGKTRMLPYEVLVPYMQARRRGRGPDKVGQRAPTRQQGGPAVSGYRHSGMSEQDHDDRQALLDAVSVIERRWPDEQPVLVRDLRDLVETVGEEAEASDG
jgi:hypothetical protein